jgi:molecular chaperone DnaJ
MDLYAVLGVSRAASAGEIDRAFRRLSRRYHPGINPGDRVARDLYEQIQQAYAVLTDETRRRDYDRGGAAAASPLVEARVAFAGFDFSAPAEGASAATFSELFADVFQEAAREAIAPTRGADLALELVVPFAAAVTGGTLPISVVRQERCPHCAGDGRVVRPPVVCPACEGLGAQRWARGHMVFTRSCAACGGDGRQSVEPCRPCQGLGVQPRSEVVTLALAPGLEDGARIAVPGRGHAGSRGGPAGDLYVTVRVAPHRHFRREGRDLLVTLPVAVHEAALGARVDVPTLDGRARLRIPPGTAGGARLRLRGQGVPSASGREEAAGDLVVEIHLVLPSMADARLRDLMRDLARLSPGDVRRHLFDEGAGPGES